MPKQLDRRGSQSPAERCFGALIRGPPWWWPVMAWFDYLQGTDTAKREGNAPLQWSQSFQIARPLRQTWLNQTPCSCTRERDERKALGQVQGFEAKFRLKGQVAQTISQPFPHFFSWSPGMQRTWPVAHLSWNAPVLLTARAHFALFDNLICLVWVEEGDNGVDQHVSAKEREASPAGLSGWTQACSNVATASKCV